MHPEVCASGQCGRGATHNFPFFPIEPRPNSAAAPQGTRQGGGVEKRVGRALELLHTREKEENRSVEGDAPDIHGGEKKRAVAAASSQPVDEHVPALGQHKLIVGPSRLECRSKHAEVDDPPVRRAHQCEIHLGAARRPRNAAVDLFLVFFNVAGGEG